MYVRWLAGMPLQLWNRKWSLKVGATGRGLHNLFYGELKSVVHLHLWFIYWGNNKISAYHGCVILEWFAEMRGLHLVDHSIYLKKFKPLLAESLWHISHQISYLRGQSLV